LRPAGWGHGYLGRGHVVPSAKDGLHCGGAGVSAGVASRVRVVPSAKDGLHCGYTLPLLRALLPPVVPSAKDGLHCGRQQQLP